MKTNGLAFYKRDAEVTIPANTAYIAYDGDNDFLPFGSEESTASYTLSLKEGTEDADKCSSTTSRRPATLGMTPGNSPCGHRPQLQSGGASTPVGCAACISGTQGHGLFLSLRGDCHIYIIRYRGGKNG